MRLRNYILAFVFPIFVSCEQFLEEKPYSFLSEANFPDKASDGRIALNGIYQVFKNQNIRGYAFTVTNIADSDLGTFGASRTDAYGIWADFIRTSADAVPLNLWTDLYRAINSCNFVIDVVEKKGFEGGDQIIAEAKGLRAFFYMELTNHFGDAPLKSRNTVGINELNMPRTSINEIRQLCIDDLDYAEATMAKYPAIFAVHTRGGLLTLGAVRMIKAHLYMYMAGWRRSWDGQMIAGDKKYWTNVRDLCQNIINMGVYDLDPDFTNVFKSYYLDKYNKETIWEIDFAMPENGSTFPNALASPPYGANSAGGFGNMRSTIDFYNKFDPMDVRRDWTLGSGSFVGFDFKPNATIDKRPHINKFRKVSGNGNHGWNTPYNTPVYRYSGVYLMLAEALNEINNGPTQEAYDAINKVRFRARPAANKTDGTVLPDLKDQNYESFKAAIIDERAFELGFEGFRRMDIIRWGIYIERIQLVSDSFYGMAKASNGREYHILKPIPLQELNQNHEWAQNDGW